MQGFLTKPNKSIGSKKRFFVLQRCTLTYYENETKTEKLADIFLSANTRVTAAGAQQINIENVSVGTKHSAKTSYVLLCNIDPNQRDQWIAALTSACGIEEAERLKALQEQARLDAERREAEERARREAEEAQRLMLQSQVQQPVVFDIPEPMFDLKPREQVAVTSQAVLKACAAQFGLRGILCDLYTGL